MDWLLLSVGEKSPLQETPSDTNLFNEGHLLSSSLAEHKAELTIAALLLAPSGASVFL